MLYLWDSWMWIYFKSILDRVTIIYFVDVYNVLKYTFTDRTDKLYVHVLKTDIVMAFFFGIELSEYEILNFLYRI